MKERIRLYIVLLIVESIFAPFSAFGYKRVNIDTNGVLPSYEIIDHPEGAAGHSITNITKVPGQIQIFSEDSVLLYDSGPFVPDTSGMKIRVRGNTSVNFPQLSYKVKLQKKADLLLREDSVNHRDKNWLLLGAQLYQIVGLCMNELLRMPYAPKCEMVELIINDSICGLYLLTEAVNRNSGCRINVNKENGYIIERDAYWWNEPLYFTSNMYNTILRWTFKLPDDGDVTPQKLEFITNAINTLETALTEEYYTDYLDVPSFARWLLGQDVLGIWDGWGSNLFLCKYDERPENKFFIPCLWDFDTMASLEYKGKWVWVHTHEEDSYFPWLLSNTLNPAFVNAYCDAWDSISNTLLSTMNECMAPYSTIFPDEYATYTEWFEERKAFMDENINLLRASSNALINNRGDVRNESVRIHINGQIYIVLFDGTTYNVLGQRVSSINM